ncbi:lysine decarboxylase [Natronobacillus azotifigens]|uniref:Aminotransferase class I/II-fold pyridoxal phosphate-dependent enzyme n=1 Tax=Natronobacillus azotifigens TaxID=472978 RepID=A0A9J6RDT2_9BACI|nr:aminotransferase class I/II-fold pyridoxal phosphate-dependent enzyme [Natronobacillus azotifigens]MCZ0703629.1 aminotransferase class I/II-fold pyridoxal phosphate-dependent enzyme [Natronobacillus azotifigens]
MKRENQTGTPLFSALDAYKQQNNLSFHVPGHKNGTVFPEDMLSSFQSILPIDLTELTGLDDLHEPAGIIEKAESLAKTWFGSLQSYFLIGGSTVGNLAMLLATCVPGENVIVQRNSHKSILNGIELSGAIPIFVSPSYNQKLNRYTNPSMDQYKEAIEQYPDAKAIVVTYPDYFGHTYDLKQLIDLAHDKNIPILVDEAHGVHFSIDHDSIPISAVKLGADIVVQSAHKMAPAMTMTAYLHYQSRLVDERRVKHYLSMLQSSSPSYPLLASLDVARYFLANVKKEEITTIIQQISQVRAIFSQGNGWDVLPCEKGVDDPFKITLQVRDGYSTDEIIHQFEAEGVFPELATDKHILFILGLAKFSEEKRLESVVKKITRKLKFVSKHATIERKPIAFPKKISKLVYNHDEMNQKEVNFCDWNTAIGKVVAETVVPYPPGIPYLLRGERVTQAHVETIHYLMKEKINFQQTNLEQGICVFEGE